MYVSDTVLGTEAIQNSIWKMEREGWSPKALLR